MLHLVLLLAAGQDAALSPLEYHDARARAEALVRTGDRAAAAADLAAMLATVPWDGDAWRELGLARYVAGEMEGARAAFTRALEVGARRPEWLHFYDACAAARLGDADGAFRSLDAALAARFEDRSRIAGTDDLASLRGEPRWPTATGAPDMAGLDRDAGWRLDVEHLVAEARRMHAGPERPAGSPAFLAEAEAIQAAVPELSDDELLARLMRLVALLDDGHSAIYGPGPDTPLAFEGRTLPLRFYAFADGVHVIDGHGEWARLAGRRVLAMGGLDPEEVLRRLAPYRGADNPMTWRWMGPQFYLGTLAALRRVGAAAPGADAVTLRLAAPDGGEETVAVPAGHHPRVRKLRPSPAAAATPRYLARVDDAYWMEPLADRGAVYLQFNQVRDAPGEDLAAFAERLRGALRAEGVRAVVVDVRHNNGGNNSLVRPLVRALSEFEMRAPGNRILVITGRNTFSAAQNFVNRVERWTDAIFVGEPSASSPNFVGEETELVLPYSRLRGSLSTRYWQDSDPGDARAWIAPHVPVPPTAADYFAGRDAALAAALAVVERG